MGKILFWCVLHGIAFNAGGPLGPVVVGVLWYVVTYLPQKKAAEREEAKVFDDWTEHTDLLHTRLTVDLEEMTFRSVTSAPGKPDEIEEGTVERKGEGKWRQRLNDRGAWQALDGHLASRLEVAYQRYLRTL